MNRMVADYEKSEEQAIKSGKAALDKAPWLRNREVEITRGFFAELRKNDVVHPNHYSVHLVDGNGTKLFLSPWSGDYRLAPIDGGNMNANDIATLIRAYPSELNIYLACQTGIEEEHMGEIMTGFVDFFEEIRYSRAPFDLNIGKIETASLDEMISLGVPNKGFDLGISMVGYIRKSNVPKLQPKQGDRIIGVTSTGLHSNGYTGARHVLLRQDPELEYREEWREKYEGKFALGDRPSVLKGKTILEALQVTTAFYLPDAHAIGNVLDSRDIYGINITGNGLYNFNRAGEGVSFEITNPMPLLPIHKLLVEESRWDPQKAYTKQNMGMGFAYVVPRELSDEITDIINDGDNRAQDVGEVRNLRKSETELRTTLHKPYEGKALDFIGYNN